MSSTSSPAQNRQPKGIPTGGQFAASAHAEASVSLTEGDASTDLLAALQRSIDEAKNDSPLRSQASTDDWLPPGAHQVVDCPICRGSEPAVLTCRYCGIDGKVTTDRYGQVPFRPDVPGTKVAFEDPRDGEWRSATITAATPDSSPENFAVGLLADGTARDIYMRKAIPLQAAQAAARNGVNSHEMIEEAASEMHIGLDPTHDEIRAFLARIDDGYCEDIARSAHAFRRYRAEELREEGRTGPALDTTVDPSTLGPETVAAIDRAVASAADFKGQHYSAMTYVTGRDHWHGNTVVITPSGRVATYKDTAWDAPSEAPMLPWSAPEGTPVAHVALDGTVRRIDQPETLKAPEARW